jgi:hypothetical protein
VETLEWKELVEELKRQWGTLWRERIDDKERAEGIANRDYEKLFVERGLVVVATRNFKPLSFAEVLERHKPSGMLGGIPPSPSVGGWGKFARNVLSKEKKFTKKMRPAPPEPEPDRKQQLKKGGRGWLHF